jgi:ABC-type nitrate/sulfonate/bicarbonate transport system substrate-binding protein
MGKALKLIGRIAFGLLLTAGIAFGQQKPKLRPLRIALPSHSVSSSPVYIAKSLGIFESYGFDPQILVLERRRLRRYSPAIWIFTPLRNHRRAALRACQPRRHGCHESLGPVCRAAKEFTSEQLRGRLSAVIRRSIRQSCSLNAGHGGPEIQTSGGTNRAAALLSGNIPAAVLTAVEAARLTRQGFRVLARASADFELSSGGLGTAIASLQNKRDVMRSAVQAAMEGLRIAATQKERVLPIYKQFALTTEEAHLMITSRSWASMANRPRTPTRFEADQAHDMGLKELPKLEADL